MEGFIDNDRFENDRFESKRTKRRILSFSTWADEKAVIHWRTQGDHHGVQEKGRFEVLEDHHLRVGEITADFAPPKVAPSSSSASTPPRPEGRKSSP